MPQEFVVRPARVAVACGAAVAAVGLLILFAWATGNEAIKTLQAGWPTMKANTALGFLACGSALALCAQGRERWARVPAALALAIGSLTLSQYLFGVDLGIDELLFQDTGSAAGTTAPGRLAILTATDFILVSLALLTWRVPTHASTFALLLAGFIALFNLAFFFLGAIPPVQGTRMAVHTALAFTVLCVGCLVGRKGELAHVLLGRGEAGATARRLMLPVVGLPLLFGFLARESVRDGVLSADQARAFALFGNLTVLAVLVGFALVRLRRESDLRLAAEAVERSAREQRVAAEQELERLRRTDRFRSEFINSTAHELATPLTPLLLNLSTLRPAVTGEAGQRALAKAERSAERLRKVVGDMVAAADLQARAIVLDRQRLDLAAALPSAAARHADAAQRAQVRLECEAGPPLWVLADPVRLQAVLDHLLANALKFTPAGGSVRLSAHVAEGQARVEVSDTGIGLSAAHIQELWRPYGQAHDKSQRTDSGAGLGLYVVKGIVELHKGEVGVSSPGPGKGSTFWFTLPLAPGS